MSLLSIKINALVQALDQGHFSASVLERQDFLQIAASEAAAKRALLRQLEASWSKDEQAPLLELHRLAGASDVEQRRLVLELKAPVRQIAWQQTSQLELDCFIYSEANDRHHVVLPGAGLHFLVADRDDAASLNRIAHQQLQVWLSMKPAAERLRVLAEVQRRGSGNLISTLDLDLLAKSAKQREMAKHSDGAESVLKAVATPMAKLPQPAECLDELAARIDSVLRGAIARSVLLIGPSGCGKTSACIALSRRADFPFTLYTTSGTRLIAGQSGFGMWQARTQQLLRELASKKDASQAGRPVLHVGNLLELMEVGRTRQGEQSIASFMRADIARGSALIIAECTPEQFALLARLEPGLLDAFESIDCLEPNLDQQLQILKNLSTLWLSHAPTPVEIEALKLSLDLHEQFCGYSARPAKVIGFVSRLCQNEAQQALTSARVIQQFIAETGLPELLLKRSMAFNRQAITQWFGERVMGQAKAVDAVVDRLSQIKAQLARRKRPLASLVLIGPTGVGKTELAKTLAEFLFGAANRLLRFDLSQVTDALAVQRLIGSPLFGDAEGLLTARVREQPFSVLLLDEFEKAHTSFFDLLLQILGDGRISDGNARVADFSNCVILLTSNLGASARQLRLGFNPQSNDASKHYQRALQDFLRPEIYNRFDAIVPFDSLDSKQIQHILQRELQALRRRQFFLETQSTLDVSAEALATIATRGFDPHYGARALKRSVERLLSAPLAVEYAKTVAHHVNDAALRHLSLKHSAADQKPLQLMLGFECTSAELRWRNQVFIGDAKTDASGAATQLARASQHRRLLDALNGCEELSNWRDERLLLQQQQRRLLKRLCATTASSSAKRDRSLAINPNPQVLSPRDAQRLSLLDQALDRLRQSLQRAEAIEDALTVAALSDSTADPSQLAKAESEVLPLKQQLLRLRYPNPDNAHIAVIADHADWLLLLLRNYQTLTANEKWRCTLTHLIERPPAKVKGSDNRVLRIVSIDQRKDAQDIFSAASSKYLGAVLQIEGENAAIKLALEYGLHVLKKRSAQAAADANSSPINQALLSAEGDCCARVSSFDIRFSVPAAWANPKQLAALNEMRRRVFDIEREELSDGVLDAYLPRAKFKRRDLSAAMFAAQARAWQAELLRFGAADAEAVLREGSI